MGEFVKRNFLGSNALIYLGLAIVKNNKKGYTVFHVKSQKPVIIYPFKKQKEAKEFCRVLASNFNMTLCLSDIRCNWYKFRRARHKAMIEATKLACKKK